MTGQLPRKVRVEVMQEDIDNGAISNESCPIALAFRRATGALHTVSVDCFRIDALDTATSDDFPVSHFVFYPLPPEASQFVTSFDSHQPVRPFSFEVTAS